MSYVIAAPEIMTSAATDLATIGSDLSTARTAATVPTVALAPAAADEVSAGVARLFSGYAEDFHSLLSQATAAQGQFAHNLHSAASSYANSETALAGLLNLPGNTLSNAINNVLNNIGRTLGNLPEPLNTALGFLFSVFIVFVFFPAVFVVVAIEQVIKLLGEALASLLP